MSKVKLVKSNEIFPIISEILENSVKARITVTGMSMYPFLREGIDSVELSKGSINDIKPGTIVMIRRKSGCYVMHRAIRKNTECFYIVGDAQQWIEGPIYSHQLVAVVTAVWRRDKRIECSSFLWKFLSNIWLHILPFRYLILNSFKTIRRIM
jgi:signal peptidase I